METLCRIKDIHLQIVEFELLFEKTHQLGLNEGMLLCSLQKVDRLTSGSIADILGLSASNTSKVIKLVEGKGLISRIMGDKDRRQMYFSLTPEGKERLESITCNAIELPEMLKLMVEK